MKKLMAIIVAAASFFSFANFNVIAEDGNESSAVIINDSDTLTLRKENYATAQVVGYGGLYIKNFVNDQNQSYSSCSFLKFNLNGKSIAQNEKAILKLTSYGNCEFDNIVDIYAASNNWSKDTENISAYEFLAGGETATPIASFDVVVNKAYDTKNYIKYSVDLTDYIAGILNDTSIEDKTISLCFMFRNSANGAIAFFTSRSFEPDYYDNWSSVTDNNLKADRAYAEKPEIRIAGISQTGRVVISGPRKIVYMNNDAEVKYTAAYYSDDDELESGSTTIWSIYDADDNDITDNFQITENGNEMTLKIGASVNVDSIKLKASNSSAEGVIDIALEKAPSQERYIVDQDGAWCWYGGTGSVRHIGQYDKTYVSYISSTGDIKISEYDHNTGITKYNTLRSDFQCDDHNNPAVFIREDGRIIVFFAGHSIDKKIYYRISTNPEDISSFESEQVMDAENVDNMGKISYPNPYKLSTQPNKIFMFFRGFDWQPSLVVSSDNGETWNTPIHVIKNVEGSSKRPYTKYESDGVSKIHFVFTDNHPRDAVNHIYHAYMEDGKFYKSDGTFIKNVSDGPLLLSEATVVYNTVHNGIEARGWNWDIKVDENGYPRILYTASPGTGTKPETHYYCYAYWNGSEWVNKDICDGGSYFPEDVGNDEQREPHYAGGMCFDPVNTNVVYLSRPKTNSNGKSVFEIEKWILDDDMQNWTTIEITDNSDMNNVRPVVPLNRKSGECEVQWMYGHYTYWLEGFDTSIASLTNYAQNDEDEEEPGEGGEEPGEGGEEPDDGEEPGAGEDDVQPDDSLHAPLAYTLDFTGYSEELDTDSKVLSSGDKVAIVDGAAKITSRDQYFIPKIKIVDPVTHKAEISFKLKLSDVTDGSYMLRLCKWADDMSSVRGSNKDSASNPHSGYTLINVKNGKLYANHSYSSGLAAGVEGTELTDQNVPVSKDTWYDIKIEMDFSAKDSKQHTLKVYLNTELVNKEKQDLDIITEEHKWASYSSASTLGIAFANNTPSTDVFIDDIKINGMNVLNNNMTVTDLKFYNDGIVSTQLNKNADVNASIGLKNFGSGEITAVAYLAAYDADNRLIDIVASESKPIASNATDTLTFATPLSKEILGEAQKCTLFVWDGSTMKPYTNTVYIDQEAIKY